jgi:hypothetical protein
LECGSVDHFFLDDGTFVEDGFVFLEIKVFPGGDLAQAVLEELIGRVVVKAGVEEYSD